MAAATAVRVKQGREQLGGLFSEMWSVSATLDVGSLVDAAGSSDTIAVPGVALGDMVIAVSFGVSVAGITVTGFVSAANVVTIRMQNESAGTLDLASTTVKVLVGRPAF